MKRKLPIVTVVITVICIVNFIAQYALGYGNNTEGMILFGAYYKPFIIAGEWWRLLTVGFVHASIWHLLMNMMALYSLGQALETMLGKGKFLLILFGSVLGGSVFLFASQGNTVTVGLSAGLYGLIVTYVMIVYRMGGFKIPRVRNSVITTIAINLMINFIPGVSWVAHMGGAITGFVLTGLFVKNPNGVTNRNPYAFAVTAFVISLGYLSYTNCYIPSNQVYLLSDYRILTAERQFLPESYIEGMAKRLDNIYGSDSVLQDAINQKGA